MILSSKSDKGAHSRGKREMKLGNTCHGLKEGSGMLTKLADRFGSYKQDVTYWCHSERASRLGCHHEAVMPSPHLQATLTHTS